jgi:hypothetical protein
MSFGQRGQQPVAAGRDDDDLRFDVPFAGFTQYLFEFPKRFEGSAFLHGAVRVVQRAAHRHQRPDEPSLATGDLVEVAGPDLIQLKNLGCLEVLEREGIRGVIGCILGR